MTEAVTSERSPVDERAKPPGRIHLSAKIDPAILRHDDRSSKALVRRALLASVSYQDRVACENEPSFDSAIVQKIAEARKNPEARGPVLIEVEVVPRPVKVRE
jgi:hypothetical protein